MDKSLLAGAFFTCYVKGGAGHGEFVFVAYAPTLTAFLTCITASTTLVRIEWSSGRNCVPIAMDGCPMHGSSACVGHLFYLSKASRRCPVMTYMWLRVIRTFGVSALS